MRRVLSGMGVVPIAHNKDDGNRDRGGSGNLIDGIDNNNIAVKRGKLLSLYLCDGRAAVLLIIITKRNLSKLFCSSSTSLMVGPWTSNAMYWTIVKHACRIERGGPFKDGDVPSGGDVLCSKQGATDKQHKK
jgi:hypothetical protein